jgi:hypothetical protein
MGYLQSIQLPLGIVWVSGWNALQASQNLFKKFVPPTVDSQGSPGWVWPLRLVKFVEGRLHTCDFPLAAKRQPHFAYSITFLLGLGPSISCVETVLPIMV